MICRTLKTSQSYIIIPIFYQLFVFFFLFVFKRGKRRKKLNTGYYKTFILLKKKNTIISEKISKMVKRD